MTGIEAFILGIIQGLTEFLPVSSSGHLEIGKVLLGVEGERSLIFTIAVHGATVLSTIVVFRKELLALIKGLFKFRWNSETKYIWYIALSMIPVGIVGLLLESEVEKLFDGSLILVGSMLILTSLLLLITKYVKEGEREVKGVDAFIIGLSQALAILPGLSRSGTTIATGLYLGNKRDEITKFSFLMVLVPVIGKNILSLLSGDMSGQNSSVSSSALAIGFIAAFVTGVFACKLMIRIVKKGNLAWFSLYCGIIGIIAIAFGIF